MLIPSKKKQLGLSLHLYVPKTKTLLRKSTDPSKEKSEASTGANKAMIPFLEFPKFIVWDSHSGVVSLIQADVSPPNNSRFQDLLPEIQTGAVTPAGNAIIFLHKGNNTPSTSHELSIATLGQSTDGVLGPGPIERLHSIKMRCPCTLALKTNKESGLVQQVLVANLNGEMEIVDFSYE